MDIINNFPLTLRLFIFVEVFLGIIFFLEVIKRTNLNIPNKSGVNSIDLLIILKKFELPNIIPVVEKDIKGMQYEISTNKAYINANFARTPIIANILQVLITTYTSSKLLSKSDYWMSTILRSLKFILILLIFRSSIGILYFATMGIIIYIQIVDYNNRTKIGRTLLKIIKKYNISTPEQFDIFKNYIEYWKKKSFSIF